MVRQTAEEKYNRVKKLQPRSNQTLRTTLKHKCALIEMVFHNSHCKKRISFRLFFNWGVVASIYLFTLIIKKHS